MKLNKSINNVLIFLCIVLIGILIYLICSNKLLKNENFYFENENNNDNKMNKLKRLKNAMNNLDKSFNEYDELYYENNVNNSMLENINNNNNFLVRDQPYGNNIEYSELARKHKAQELGLEPYDLIYINNEWRPRCSRDPNQPRCNRWNHGSSGLVQSATNSFYKAARNGLENLGEAKMQANKEYPTITAANAYMKLATLND